MTQLSIEWNINPMIFQIKSFGISWYGVLFASSFVVGYFIMRKIFRRDNLPEALLDKLAIYMLLATVVGARLGHVFFYQWDYYRDHILEIFMVWKGGLASHGAAIGILLALFLFVRNTNVKYLWILDRIVIPVALSGFFIRMGNLFNSEIYGTPTDLPWGFVFVRDIQNDGLPHHPTQIYEALGYLAIFIFLFRYFFKRDGKFKQGFILGLFLVLVFGFRLIIEIIKKPQVNFENNLLLNMGQSLSIPFILAGIVLILYKPRVKEPEN